MALVAELTRTTLYWLNHSWRPQIKFSWASLKEMSSLGLPLMGSNLIGVVINQMHSFAIGKLYSTNDVGFFSRGRSLHKLPVMGLTSAIGKVSFPVFVEVKDQPQRLVNGVRTILRTMAFLVFPIVALLAGSSHSLVQVLFDREVVWCCSVFTITSFRRTDFSSDNHQPKHHQSLWRIWTLLSYRDRQTGSDGNRVALDMLVWFVGNCLWYRSRITH